MYLFSFVLSFSNLCIKALSHWARHDKAKQFADERSFHTEREMIDYLRLIHACTIGAADQEYIFPHVCIS